MDFDVDDELQCDFILESDEEFYENIEAGPSGDNQNTKNDHHKKNNHDHNKNNHSNTNDDDNDDNIIKYRAPLRVP